MKTLLSTLALLLALATPTAAQTVTVVKTANATLTFVASTAHDTVIGTLALVTGYDLTIFEGTTALATVPLGKPTPAPTTNLITGIVSSSGLPKNVVLTAVVTVTGPGGSSGSAPSNPFAFVVAPPAASSVTIK